jgi:uncharacterized protein (DUF1330 family)
MTGPIVVATLQFKDEERYRRYQAAFPPIFALSGGRILVADEEPTSISGNGGSISKIVIMQFEDNAAMKALLTNPEYIEISKDRDAGAEVTSWVVKPFANA